MSASGPHVVFDADRIARIGLDEAVFSASKPPSVIADLVRAMTDQGRRLLLTRLGADQWDSLPDDVRPLLDFDPLSGTAILGPLPVAPDTPVGVVTAGTSDAAVAAEAQRTLAYHGVGSDVVADVGVAGLWRLMNRLDDLRRHAVLIVAAGMDAALPSVIGGLVACPVIALPTSVGYGIAAGGRTALNAALASCAPGVTVVNIDNGYGAACAAIRILGIANRRQPLDLTMEHRDGHQER